MDNNNNPLPTYVQVDDKQLKAKADNEYVIFYSQAEDALPSYTFVKGAEACFVTVMELKKQGAFQVVVYKRVEMRVQVS